MLQFTRLALRRGSRLLLDDTSLQIHPGQKVGVTGANGTGKSSLFALILGDIGPDAGTIRVPVDWIISHVAQQTPSDTRASIEYVLDGDAELRDLEHSIEKAELEHRGEQLASLHGRYEIIGGYAARSRAGQLLHGLGFKTGDERRAVNEFSGGWRMRLNLAQALMCRSDLLLLDEPTNHLDLDAVIWLEGWLNGYDGTLLLISHDRDFLDQVVNRVINLEHGRATLYSGNYSAFERIRAERLALQQAQHAKQQQQIAHMRAFVDRFRAKASKARQAQSRIKALERMQTIAAAHVDTPFRFRLLEPLKVPKPLLRLDDVAAGYGETTVLHGVRLTIAPGDRIGLLGPNGAGKSTLIKLLAGQLQARAGEVDTARDLKVGYFAQHQVEQLHPENSALQHLAAIDPAAREGDLRNWLGGFGFAGDTVFMPTEPFSGGEKSRLALALLVYQRPNLLLLDEPTNHLDLEMRQALAVALQDFAGAMVIVSHDRHLLRVSTDTLLLVHAGRVSEFDGDLDAYPGWLSDQSRSRRAVAANNVRQGAADRKTRKRRDAEKRRLLAPLKKAIYECEKELTALQAEKNRLDMRLADSSLYAEGDSARVRELLAEQAHNQNLIAAAESRWLEASALLEKEQSG